MKSKVEVQLNLVGKALHWIDETESMKGGKRDNAHQILVNFRRKLRKKQYALEGNPAAALYGESQAGKSYLVSSLLSVKGEQFKLDDASGHQYDFKKDINPRGNETESTSVATRFSANFTSAHDGFPIGAKLLSPSDLILIICEAYYNNLKVSNPLSYDELKNKISSLGLKYSTLNPCQQLITEDHIFDIEEYFNNNFSKLVFNNLKDAKFFEQVSKVADKIPAQDWSATYSILWNHNPELTQLFDDLLNAHQQINYTQEVFLPIQSVLREHGTILDVSRLDEIYGDFKGQEPNYKKETELLFLDQNGKEKRIDFPKPLLCALCAELVFALPKQLIEKKTFLAHTDLLDFPGTRRFESTNENEITKESLTKLLRRGKVDYLFNNYSNNERINTLLFCQNHKQSNQSVIPEKLNRWIEIMVGKTPDEREQFKAPVPPLFIISTWFNKDLEFAHDVLKDNGWELKERWNQRFIKTLSGEIIKDSDYKWFNNWTKSTPFFQNIYLLRDFEKSSDVGGNSQLFRGYNDRGIEIEPIQPEQYPDFREDLKKEFLNFEFVKNHFSNPELAWNEAATLNKDGSELILLKLTESALHINAARQNKLEGELKQLKTSLNEFLRTFYNSPDKAENLFAAVQKAGLIQAKLDAAFGKDPCFFGVMMKELMLRPSDVYNLFLEKIRDIERRDVVNLDKYSMIRLRVPTLSPSASFEHNLKVLSSYYEEESLEECQELFEKEFGLDLNELFFANKERVISLSEVLAKELEQFWYGVWMQKNLKNVPESVPEEVVADIQLMLRSLYVKLNMTEIIAAKIRRYVDGYRSVEEVYEMISDISAELVNSFINTAGYAFYNESSKDDLIKANKKIKKSLKLEHPEFQFENVSKGQVAELITQMGNLPELLNQNPIPIEKIKTLPNYSNYLRWSDLMKAGFITSSGIPNYDPIANDKLGAILKEIETIDL